MNNDAGRKGKAVVLFSLLSLSFSASAYEVDTHADITRNAFDRSGLAGQKRNDLGLRVGELFPNVEEDLHTLVELFMDGARWEDGRGLLYPFTLVKPAHHFFDPVNDLPLSFYPISLISEKSPDWALEDRDEFSTQNNSYRDAREFFYDAQTKPTKQERDKAWGRLFQSLGQVVHHIQDMAQPQHVRDDIHGDAWVALGVTLATDLVVGIRAYNPSHYEEYTNEYRGDLPYDVRYGPVNGFTEPRQYWANEQGQGIAQFTNRNFFSDGTNAGSNAYDSPSINQSLMTTKTIQEVCAEAPCPNPNLTGNLNFYGNMVEDRYTGEQIWNPYATTSSLFDKRLESKGFFARHTLNRFNFMLAHSLLIPRAVGYSSGLIDYFFRGELTVKGAKPHGVFALADQRPPSPGASQGFSRIKASLLNETPPITDVGGGGDVPQEMSQGKLIAVAKFYRDECFNFTDGTSGAYLVPPMGYVPCRSSEEEIILFNEIDIGPGSTTIPTSGEPVMVTFEFPEAIPLNATDLSMQFVYRGVLGSESDAVVVKSINLSEPGPIQVSNDWDWDFDADGNAIRVDDPPDLPQVIFVFAEGATIPPQPLFGFSESGVVGGGQYAGVWALVDVDAPPRVGAAICDTCGLTLYPYEPYRVESEVGSSQATRFNPVYNARGMWGSFGISFYNSFPEKCAGKTIAECWTENFSPYDPVGPSADVEILWGDGP